MSDIVACLSAFANLRELGHFQIVINDCHVSETNAMSAKFGDIIANMAKPLLGQLNHLKV